MKGKTLLVILVALAAVAYYIYQDEELRNQVLGKTHQVIPELNKSILYKWKDKAGNWQVSDRPPTDGTPYTTVSTEDQVNVIPGKKEN